MISNKKVWLLHFRKKCITIERNVLLLKRGKEFFLRRGKKTQQLREIKCQVGVQLFMIFNTELGGGSFCLFREKCITIEGNVFNPALSLTTYVQGFQVTPLQYSQAQVKEGMWPSGHHSAKSTKSPIGIPSKISTDFSDDTNL